MPTIVVPAAFEFAEVSTGKFCRLLAPLSASPASLAVMPLAPRSMPRPPLTRIELPRIALPAACRADSPRRRRRRCRRSGCPAPAAVPPIVVAAGACPRSARRRRQLPWPSCRRRRCRCSCPARRCRWRVRCSNAVVAVARNDVACRGRGAADRVAVGPDVELDAVVGVAHVARPVPSVPM